jgi:hypothetical protein
MSSTLDAQTGLPEASSGPALPGVLPSGVTPPDTGTASPTSAQMEQAAMAYYNANPQIQQAIQQEYGDMAWALQIPEVAKIIITAGIYGWDQGTMDGAISGTAWYKSASQSMRTWQATLSSDPATAQQAINTSMWQINQIETQLGVTLSVQQEQNLASQANMFNWSSDQLTQIIANGYSNQILTTGATGAGSYGVNEGGPNGTPGVLPDATPTSATGAPGGAVANAVGGTAGSFQDQAQQLFHQYLVKLSPQALQQWTSQAIKGQVNIQGLENSLRQQALQRYPWMSSAISAGMTPQDYLQPYTQDAATTLAKSPDQIDWTDPTFMSHLTNTAADGTVTPKNQSDFITSLKQDPTLGYQNTQAANDVAYSTVQTLQQVLGKTKS